MSRGLDALLRQIERQGLAVGPRVRRIMTGLYGKVKLDDLKDLLKSIAQNADPVGRVKQLGRLMRTFDRAGKLLQKAPAEVLALFGPQVRGRLDLERQILHELDPKFKYGLKPVREMQFVSMSQERFGMFWSGETQRFRKQVEIALRAGLQAGHSGERIAEDIRQRTKVSQSRATFIAEEELRAARAFGSMQSQIEMGITRYTWVTQRDGRVRSEHAALDGEVRSWDSGLTPGSEIRCRCYSVPVLKEVSG